MFKKIFRSSLLTAMIVLLASIFLIMGILHGIFENQLEDQLQKETAFVATAIENEGISYFDNLSKDGDRVTLIDKDGTVLADSQVDVSKLENHGDREEVKQAETEGRGQSVRYSSTMTEKTVYYAQKLDNGQILRISADQFTIVTILLGISQPIAIVVIAAIVLSLILSTNVAKHIVEPINDLDLDDPMENTVYDELSPLLRKIAHQNSTIEEQLKEARQKQEEFRIITDNMSEGFIVIDNQMKILTYNAAALKLFGAEQKTPENILALSRSKPFRDAIYKSLDGEHSQAEMTTDERVYSIISNPVYDTV